MERVLYNRSVWFCMLLRQNTLVSLEFQSRRFSRCFIGSEVNERDANPATGVAPNSPGDEREEGVDNYRTAPGWRYRTRRPGGWAGEDTCGSAGLGSGRPHRITSLHGLACPAGVVKPSHPIPPTPSSPPAPLPAFSQCHS